MGLGETFLLETGCCCMLCIIFITFYGKKNQAGRLDTLANMWMTVCPRLAGQSSFLPHPFPPALITCLLHLPTPLEEHFLASRRRRRQAGEKRNHGMGRDGGLGRTSHYTEGRTDLAGRRHMPSHACAFHHLPLPTAPT